ncbi:putative universal stress protein [Elsinoe australis]|uniref:Putative universal stress protein n=1 Tax=Elsinoe australis TaxID=40998 RepID=A0A4U7AP81_9PEZI|nr:putative universal stress protein [Elsinoe australis]
MSLGLGHALAEEARELREEDEKQRKEAKASRAARSGSIAGINSGITLPSAPPDKSTPIEPPTPTTTEAPRPPSESAATFAHRRKASQETRPRERALAAVFSGKKISLPGDLGPGDPRRVASPAPKRLPGDLGPNDPRRAASPATSKSQSPSRRRKEGQAGSPKTGRPRRASDGALLRPKKKRESDAGAPRLEKDKDNVSSSSDEDNSDESDDERGRGRERSSRNNSVVEDSEDSDVERHRNESFSPSGAPRSPSITVTPPTAGSEGAPKRKKPVHPHSAYDHSAKSTPRNSDDEEHMSDLRRAQKLALTMSAIHSTPSAHRVIRQIIRGDYAHFQREAEEGRRRQRVYLVATDLSPEAEYALEWTIGTVLRDGDTLLAVYAVDEEGLGEQGVEIGHGADVVRDTARIVGNLPAAEKVAQSPAPSPLKLAAGVVGEKRDRSASRIGGEKGEKTRAERERYKAAEDISGRVVKLLRKTRLQIRVVVEVFHCKSPRHMLTEVIDFLSPTMTVLGSRGRSALKGVLLGSFSNYIVNKSSVPVMVARKRLRKHTKQKLHKDGLPVAGATDGRMRLGRMSNVLEAPGGPGRRINRLAVAKVD